MEEGRVSEEFLYEGFPWKIVSKVINGRDKEKIQQRIKKIILVLDTEKSPSQDQIDSTFLFTCPLKWFARPDVIPIYFPIYYRSV